jgi:hypothetical protein
VLGRVDLLGRLGQGRSGVATRHDLGRNGNGWREGGTGRKRVVEKE